MKNAFKILLLMLFLFNISKLEAQLTPQHFTFTENTANMGTVIIPLGATSINGQPLVEGDEIGAFNQDGLCVGAVVYEYGESIGITLWGDDEMTGIIDGLVEGDTVEYRFWKYQTNTEFDDLGVIYYQGDGVYNMNCIFIVHALYSGVAPSLTIPILINPPNYSNYIPISLILRWYSVNSATRFKLQISEQPDFSNLAFEHTFITDTFLQVSDLLFDKNYYWHVKAYNNNDSSFWSFTWRFKTIKNVIDYPNLLLPPNNSFNNLLNTELKWNKVNGANRYRLQLSTNINFTNIIIQQNNLTDTTFLVNNLSYLTNYYWRVKAFSNTDSSIYSDIWKFTTYDSPVNAPTLISPQNNAINISRDTVLNWFPANNATKYRIQISEGSSFTNTLFDLNSVTDTFLLVSLMDYSKQYFWRVKAMNNTDSSLWSEEWKFTTKQLNLDTPDLISPQNNSNNISIDTVLKWHTVSEATHYKFQLSTNSDFSNIIIELNNLNDTSTIINNLNYNTKYYWRVQAWHLTISSNWSSTWSFITMYEPLEPPDLIYPPNNEILLLNSVTFKWHKRLINTDYIFQLAVDSTFYDIRTTKILEDTTTTLTNLEKEINYYWRVRVQKDNQLSDWSVVWKFNIDENFTEIDAPNLLNPLNFSTNSARKPLLQWNKVKYATNYLLQVSEYKEFGNNKIEINFNDTSYIPTSSLDTNTQYYWRVAAFKDDLVSQWSDVWSFITGAVTLQPPVLVSPPNNSEKIPVYVKFLWKTVQYAKSYRFQLATTREFDVVLFEAPFVSDTSLLKDNLSYDYKYFWRVRAENNAVFSPWSEVWIFSTFSTEDTMKIPKLISPENNSIDVLTNILFSWQSIEDIDSYQLQISKTADFLNIIYNISPISNTNYIVENFEINQTYFWRVRCADENQTYYWSDIWSFKTTSDIIISPPEEWNFTDLTGNNSSIIAQNVFSNNFIVNGRSLLKGDAIGVFYNSDGEFKCAGYTLCTNDNTAITVWGDNDMTDIKDGFYDNEIYTIKVWDSRAGKEFNANVTFIIGPDYYQNGALSVIGNLNTYVLDTFNIIINEKWNLISSNIIPADPDLNKVFMNISNSVLMVRNNINQRCIPSYSLNEIGNWNINEAYWIYSNYKDTLSIIGTKIDLLNQSISLSKGWTLLPYFLTYNQDCEITFKEIKDDLLIAKDLYGNIYIPSYNFNTIKTITPGMGLQCYFKDNTTLIFDDTTKTNEEKIPPVFNENLIGNCTSFSAVIIANIFGYDGYSVAAYNSQNQMVGIGTTKNNYAIFTVWGDNPVTSDVVDGALIYELLSIKVFKDGDTIVYKYDINKIKNLTDNEEFTELKYIQSGVLLLNGTVNSVNEDFLNNNYLTIRPNPAENFINIDFLVENEANATITINSVNGVLIEKINISNLVYGLNNKQLDISELNPGVYLIKLQIGNKVIMKRFVVL